MISKCQHNLMSSRNYHVQRKLYRVYWREWRRDSNRCSSLINSKMQTTKIKKQNKNKKSRFYNEHWQQSFAQSTIHSQENRKRSISILEYSTRDVTTQRIQGELVDNREGFPLHDKTTYHRKFTANRSKNYNKIGVRNRARKIFSANWRNAKSRRSIYHVADNRDPHCHCCHLPLIGSRSRSLSRGYGDNKQTNKQTSFPTQCLASLPQSCESRNRTDSSYPRNSMKVLSMISGDDHIHIKNDFLLNSVPNFSVGKGWVWIKWIFGLDLHLVWFSL